MELPDLPFHLAQPGTILLGAGGEEKLERLPAGVRDQEGKGWGVSYSASAASSSCLCASEASSRREASPEVARVWLESRQLKRCSCFLPSARPWRAVGGRQQRGG